MIERINNHVKRIVFKDANCEEAMKASTMAQIQLNQAWLAPWADLLAALQAQAHDLLTSLNQQALQRAVCTAQGLPIRFVPQTTLPTDCAYESFIYASGQVPSRDNLHDFFNALIWLAYPQLKQQLNRIQALEIAKAGIGQVRGTVRDGVTLFDENAAIVVLQNDAQGEALAEALRQHQWQQLFVEQRAAFGRSIQVHLFGHALLEKLCQPYKAITAHAWLMWADAGFFAATSTDQQCWIDDKLSQQLSQQTLDTHSFTPLPVLGVPGWWPGQDAVFYADASVFRPRSEKRKARNMVAT
jgi:Protein of unknown function (DUF3025)